jgi:hypothetical protein
MMGNGMPANCSSLLSDEKEKRKKNVEKRK